MKNALFKLPISWMLKYLILYCFTLFFVFSCESQQQNNDSSHATNNMLSMEEDSVIESFTKQLKVGAERTGLYLPLLKRKSIAVVANQTSKVDSLHLVDFLLQEECLVQKVFSPEHGFRGNADAGEKVNNAVDVKTGIELVSLYGINKKPTAAQMKNIDVIIFDIQDVGARFYTYISTLHYVMQACAENDVEIIVLDRPNPNGHIVDGPVREAGYKSFVGMHPIPVLHGMTIGEYAKMLNGENWIKTKTPCNLTVIECKNYLHSTFYSLPIPPSPNLRSDAAIALYPSLCLFEGTPISIGRGTENPFTVYGHPKFKGKNYEFIPKPSFGASNPRLKGELCYGLNLEEIGNNQLNKFRIDWLISAYQDYSGDDFFMTKNRWFDLLAGTPSLRKQIKENWTEQKIRASWEPALTEFKEIRNKYLIYD